MKLAEVRTLYESNYRDIPACLAELIADVKSDEVQGVVSVCVRNGEVDVRGMGHLDVFQVYALLVQGMRFLEPILLETMGGEQ
ncbi:MAG: hypothetical protein ACK52V_04735 [Betaproteobacteria bacterium]